MAAIEIVRRDLDATGLRRAARRSRDAAAARRMLALALVLEGKRRKEAAEACGMDRQTLRDWVIRYNAEGLAGLSDRRGAVGPRRRLSPEQEAEVAGWVRRGPDLAEHGVVRWRRADLARAIEARFGVVLAEREPWARCSGGSAFGGWWRVLAIPATTLRRKGLSGRLWRPHRRAAAGARPRKAAGALVA